MSSPNAFCRDVKHGEILNVLRNSPKGQLRYDTGWDEKPQAVWHLISSVQSENESIKYKIIENAINVFQQQTETKEQQTLRESEVSPASTSSGSGSRLTLSENGNGRNQENIPRLSKRRGFGIREDEYDDEAMERDFRIHESIDKINHVQQLLTYNRNLQISAAQKGLEVVEQKEKELHQYLSNLNLNLGEAENKLKEHKKWMIELNQKQDAFIQAELQASEIRRIKECELIDKHFDQKKRQLKEEKAKESAAAIARVSAAKAAEDRERHIKLLQEQEATAAQHNKQVQDLEREQKRLENEAKLAVEKAAAERLLLESQKEPSLPVDLQSFILKEDCDKYMHCNNLVQKYEEAARDIVAGSSNPVIKKFYSGASICINTPLNALANTDPRQISAKTTHFLDLIQGKPVVGTSTMAIPFNASTLPNGMVFVVRLLAFRFVKKAETEILSEKKGFIPLATIAFSICKKCPEWGSLVQAYFYKLCPFLVPFSFPREQLSLQEYCSSLGYDLKGSDSTVLTEMVGRVKGYCSLYAFMVMTFERHGQFDFGEATSFFTIGGVWEILTKTMKLNPQQDVTVVVIQTLLELLSDRLLQVYGSQFKKLMQVLIQVYLPKINEISTGASRSGVGRFQTFLEQKFSGRR